MRNALCLFVGIAMLSFVGCSSNTKPQAAADKKVAVKKSSFKLTAKERAELQCKKSCTLSEALRQRLINDSQELKLTTEELEVLKRTGKVILCGKCGHLLGTDKYKKWKAKHGDEYKPEDDFVPNSLRDRILDLSID